MVLLGGRSVRALAVGTLIFGGLTTVSEAASTTLGVGPAGATTATLFSSSTAGSYSVVVPNGVTSVAVTAVGGSGSAASNGVGVVWPGGEGAIVTSNVSVTSGELLVATVAANGNDGGLPETVVREHSGIWVQRGQYRRRLTDDALNHPDCADPVRGGGAVFENRPLLGQLVIRVGNLLGRRLAGPIVDRRQNGISDVNTIGVPGHFRLLRSPSVGCRERDLRLPDALLSSSNRMIDIYQGGIRIPPTVRESGSAPGWLGLGPGQRSSYQPRERGVRLE